MTSKVNRACVRSEGLSYGRQRSQKIDDNTSSDQLQYRFGFFELFALTDFPTADYSIFLKKCKSLDKESGKLCYQNPPEIIITAYLHHLRKDSTASGSDPKEVVDEATNEEDGIDDEGPNADTHKCRGRHLKAGSIMVYLNSISSASTRFSGVRYIPSDSLMKGVSRWVKEDGITQSPTFDPYFALPILFHTIFNLEKLCGWSHLFRVKLWAMLLLQWYIIGRPSCVTDYCALFEHTDFPTECDRCCPSTGLPNEITINMTNWKSRTESQVNKKYPLVLRCNCTRDPKYCVIKWLLEYLKLLKIEKGSKFSLTGKIFPKPKSEQYRGNVKKLFQETGETKLMECTSYSIRRAACQTVGRCGFDVSHARATMREKHIKNVGRYIGQGPLYTINWGKNNEIETDPMKNMIWYSPNAKAGLEDDFF